MQKSLIYETIQSPLGELLLVASPEGLMKLAFDSFDQTLNTLERSLNCSLVESLDELEPVKKEIREYFNHERKDFTVPLDRSLVTPFQQSVHEYISTVPYGETRSYKDVAKAVNSPKAYQAVGSACGANPLPIIVPCHRIIATNGSMGGYSGGLEIKKKLFAIEAINLS